MAELLQVMKYLFVFGPPPGKLSRITLRNGFTAVPPFFFPCWGLIWGFVLLMGQGVIQDLELAMRTKGSLSEEEETTLRAVNLIPNASLALFGGLGSYVGWFMPSLVGAYMMGNAMYRWAMHACPVVLLNTEEGRMKMELANMCGLLTSDCCFYCLFNRILTKHSDDAYLVKVVKTHYFAEHLFDDLHQDQQLFRWHPRRSCMGSALVERLKEIEAINSIDEGRSVCREITADNRPSEDLMEYTRFSW